MSLVTRDHIATFERDGFVVVEDALDAQELAHFGPAVDAAVCIPFEGSTREGGGMAYVPGSHRVELAKFVDITHSLHPEPYDILADPKIRDIEPVWVEVQPGAVVLQPLGRRRAE